MPTPIVTRPQALSKDEKILLIAKHRGLFQEVADELQVDRSIVSRVFHGAPHNKARTGKSSRVHAAIARAIARRENLQRQRAALEQRLATLQPRKHAA
jgi:hypothetical protein